jgi:threonine/homoserine/homoserine lactone efflux protein
MGALIAETLPYAVAAALAAPVVAVVTAVILAESRRPIASAWTFTAGAASLCAVFAAALLIAAAASNAFEGSSKVGPIVDVVLGSLFLVLGVSAVFSKESPEKEQARQERVQRAARGSLGTMFLTGLAAQVINADALAVFAGGLKEIAEEGVSAGDQALAVAVMLAIMLTPYYLPAVVYALSPERAGKLLRGMSQWLLARSRLLEIVVGLGFGAAFLVKGVTAL